MICMNENHQIVGRLNCPTPVPGASHVRMLIMNDDDYDIRVPVSYNSPHSPQRIACESLSLPLVKMQEGASIAYSQMQVSSMALIGGVSGFIEHMKELSQHNPKRFLDLMIFEFNLANFKKFIPFVGKEPIQIKVFLAVDRRSVNIHVSLRVVSLSPDLEETVFDLDAFQPE